MVFQGAKTAVWTVFTVWTLDLHGYMITQIHSLDWDLYHFHLALN